MAQSKLGKRTREEFDSGGEFVYTKTNAKGEKFMLYITPTSIYRMLKNGKKKDAALFFHGDQLWTRCGGEEINVRHLAHKSGILGQGKIVLLNHGCKEEKNVFKASNYQTYDGVPVKQVSGVVTSRYTLIVVDLFTRTLFTRLLKGTEFLNNTRLYDAVTGREVVPFLDRGYQKVNIRDKDGKQWLVMLGAIITWTLNLKKNTWNETNPGWVVDHVQEIEHGGKWFPRKQCDLVDNLRTTTYTVNMQNSKRNAVPYHNKKKKCYAICIINKDPSSSNYGKAKLTCFNYAKGIDDPENRQYKNKTDAKAAAKSTYEDDTAMLVEMKIHYPEIK
jgi:hypothetical protein